MNGNGSVDVLDAVAIVDHVLGKTVLAGQPLANADFNGDTLVTVADGIGVARLATLPTPTAPVLDALVSPTSLTTVTLKGAGQAGGQVSVLGGAAPVTTPVGGNGRFSVAVGLVSNRLNRLFVSVAGAAGSKSPTTTIDVIQDTQVPALFVDDPVSGVQVVNDTVDVAGRVADVLSGFMGLTVTVNGQPAHVDIGIGTNGSYLRSAVPLVLGQNDITVEVTDGAGNKTTRHTLVNRVPLTGPRLVMVSGNTQTGVVHARLADPVVVAVQQENGTPIPATNVHFEVTRSDGRLAATANAPDAGELVFD